MQLFFILAQAEREAIKKPEVACISWNATGQAIIIRNKDELTNNLLPIGFTKAKFSSFTRKLYRWGFRRDTGKQPESVVCKPGDTVFWHPLFQRDDKLLVRHMKSSTAEGKRRMSCFAQSMTQRSGPTSPALQDTSCEDQRDLPLESPNSAMQNANRVQSVATAFATNQTTLQTSHEREQLISSVIESLTPYPLLLSAERAGMSRLAEWHAATRPMTFPTCSFTPTSMPYQGVGIHATPMQALLEALVAPVSCLTFPNPILRRDHVLQRVGIHSTPRQVSLEAILLASGGSFTDEERKVFLRYGGNV